MAINDTLIGRLPMPGLLADGILMLHAGIVMFVVVGQILILVGWWQNWDWARTFWLARVIPLFAEESGVVRVPPTDLGLTSFYKKHVSANVYPIVSSEKVDDDALKKSGLPD